MAIPAEFTETAVAAGAADVQAPYKDSGNTR